MMNYLANSRFEKKKGVIKSIIYRAFFLLGILTIFSLLTLNYYSSYKLGSFPDESAHAGYVSDVNKHGFPDYKHGKKWNSEKLNHLSHPSLYYLLAGMVSRVFVKNDLFDITNVRFINTIVSSLTIFIIFKTLMVLGVRLWNAWIALLVLLCIPMFIVLSISINNDPLSIFGCALVTYGIARIAKEKNNLLTLSILLLGVLVTFLTKATGALTAIILIFCFALINIKTTINFFFSLTKIHLSLIILFFLLIFIYYVSIFISYGKLFPAPQGNPSDWFLINNPISNKKQIAEYWLHFYDGNLNTLTTPYGHVYFIDTTERKISIYCILCAIPFMAMNVINSRVSEKLYLKRFVNTLCLSFFLFFTVYFLIVMNEYLRTGYPGMTQARYFFGFLPAMVIVFALGLDSMAKNYITVAFKTTIIICIATSLYYLYINPKINSFITLQEKGGFNFGELTSERSFVQTFIAKYPGIDSVDLFLATFIRNNTSDIRCDLIDDKGEILASDNINASLIIDNSWVKFNLASSNLILGKKYGIRLTSTNSRPGNAITWYADLPHSKTINPFTGSIYGPESSKHDYFTDGEAIVDGKNSSQDFVFKIYYKQSK